MDWHWVDAALLAVGLGLVLWIGWMLLEADDDPLGTRHHDDTVDIMDEWEQTSRNQP